MSSTERSASSPEDTGNASSADKTSERQPSTPPSSQDDGSRGDPLDPGTRPLSNRASKAFVIGAFVFIFGLGTVGSILLVDVAETALDQAPVAPDSVEAVSPNPGEGDPANGAEGVPQGDSTTPSEAKTDAADGAE